MMNNVLMGLITILLIYIIIAEFIIRRKLKINNPRKGIFSKERNRIFIAIELIL